METKLNNITVDTNSVPLQGLRVSSPLGAGGSLPYFIDTTLRDGEQAPGVVFRLAEKIQIAALLDKAGVPEIEIGTPAISDNDLQDIRTLCSQGFKFKTLSWCRANKKDIVGAQKAGTNGVHISFPVSQKLMHLMHKDEKWIMTEMKQLIDFATSKFEYVTIGAQDASRAEPNFLTEFVSAAANFGASRVRLADTVGMMNPLSTSEMISRIRKVETNLALEFHAHNDLGMATANTIAAYLAGANCLSTTVNGLGERAGNAAMEEVALALEMSTGVNTGLKTELFYDLCNYVSDISKQPISYNKPVTGKMVLSHESGIHTNCILKDRSSYQLISAAKIGRKEEDFVIGKHSGKATIIHYLKESNLLFDDDFCSQLLYNVKEKAEKLKRSITKEEFLELYTGIYTNTLQFILR
ncbi:MAG: pyruvate carboxyltransferase [Paludibacter sp.]|nr:pyruvate carboxyltransferase [Paludibacter sp.]